MCFLRQSATGETVYGPKRRIGRAGRTWGDIANRNQQTIHSTPSLPVDVCDTVVARSNMCLTW